ncbi:Uncharacterized protein F383_08931 [Gossypium arboreum]|uniref:DUF2996 domain-containing protein n=8 Tax=Gossypium TaxID=3633 RepID=A0A0D2SED7_GOSRA|nr:uncharacterized protein LOC105803375 [Gossypium raimondii]XP_040937206.1 uncharacterized protein LOC107923919 [Gossypium hirsutum]KHF99204.1 Uncharacterized protein F383_08931 [Gossypium arboreum]MBA0686394.1 hypothetical protein [Gossypium aridum]MBA0769815.1 hypothetical protein [Gossypium trilobum]MBA0861651.1 hypothetical protein [Gossypium schwendimanii]PPD94670.1 hypothetical protein GOBAR_DD08321 [Gossypium barbadense]TYG94164.1 hypothetical protein ES288_A11G166400v1 [Gossypium da
MAMLGASPIRFSSFPPSSSYLTSTFKPTSSSTLSLVVVGKSIIYRRCVACSAVQESSTPTATAETKGTTPPSAGVAGGEEEVKAAPKAAAAKPKPAAKAPAKSLPELMSEDVIPSLKTILEAQDDISEIELTFQDNKLEGSFLKEGCPYSFWAFFPDGGLTGPKGFSLSSYGSGASTVEPFLVDEKKITARHVVFWVEKRLAAQGIIPVWKE